MENPQRIFNADESGFRTNPETGRVLGPINYRNFYEVKDGSEKETITCLANFSADGKIPPPMIIYPYERVSRAIIDGINAAWGVGRSKTGWMTVQIFFEYIANEFLPWIQRNNVPLPVLFIDGHRSHLTLHVCQFCIENKILLYALLPNATHILQPADVSIFGPLKAGWKNIVADFKRDNNGRAVTKTNFAKLLEAVFSTHATAEIIKNGFKKCGIYPFSADAIDYTRCMMHPSRVIGTPRDPVAKPTTFTIEHMLYFESVMPSGRAEEFRAAESQEVWTGNEKAAELFYVWRKLRGHSLKDLSHQPVTPQKNEDNANSIPDGMSGSENSDQHQQVNPATSSCITEQQ